MKAAGKGDFVAAHSRPRGSDMRIPANITAIRRETPTVRSFALDLGGREIGFSAGQWIDLFVTIEGAEAVGGYSITSSPNDQTMIRLAVKHDGSDHPVTNWLHDGAREGDQVEVSLGGDFTYTPDEAESIVLIGGGIGMTPLMSIVRTVDEISRNTCLTLLYSASSTDELLFRRELESIAANSPRIRCVFTVTRPARQTWDGRTGRIDAEMLRTEGIDLDALFFICGPPAMIQDVAAMLAAFGVPESRVRYEQWW